MFTVVEGAYYNVCIIHRVAVDPFGMILMFHTEY